jgi:hypothetical protein
LPNNKAQEFKLDSNNKWKETGKVEDAMPTNGYKFSYKAVPQILSYDFVGFAQSVNEAEEMTNKLSKAPVVKTKQVSKETGVTSGGLLEKIMGLPTQTTTAPTVSSSGKYYEGNIKPDLNTIFVFGSNPEGRHGAGAAKVAKEQFGAVYGQGEGLQGNAYALPTKDLRITANKGFKSISFNQIVENIKKLYNVANQNPTKQFKVAYRNTTDISLNGYTGLEMIEMFNQAGTIPSNIIFSKEWFDTGKLKVAESTANVDNSSSFDKSKYHPDVVSLWEQYKDRLLKVEPEAVIDDFQSEVDDWNKSAVMKLKFSTPTELIEEILKNCKAI